MNTKQALLIAVTYTSDSSVNKLKRLANVDRLQNVLKEKGYQVKTLVGSAAIKTDILMSMQQLYGRELFLFLSGHTYLDGSGDCIFTAAGGATVTKTDLQIRLFSRLESTQKLVIVSNTQYPIVKMQYVYRSLTERIPNSIGIIRLNQPAPTWSNVWSLRAVNESLVTTYATVSVMHVFLKFFNDTFVDVFTSDTLVYQSKHILKYIEEWRKKLGYDGLSELYVNDKNSFDALFIDNTNS
jgi:hypothetical protein